MAEVQDLKADGPPPAKGKKTILDAGDGHTRKGTSQLLGTYPPPALITRLTYSCACGASSQPVAAPATAPSRATSRLGSASTSPTISSARPRRRLGANGRIW